MNGIHHLLALLLLFFHVSTASALPQSPHSLSTDAEKPAAVWNNATSIQTHSGIAYSTCGARCCSSPQSPSRHQHKLTRCSDLLLHRRRLAGRMSPRIDPVRHVLGNLAVVVSIALIRIWKHRGLIQRREAQIVSSLSAQTPSPIACAL